VPSPIRPRRPALCLYIDLSIPSSCPRVHNGVDHTPLSPVPGPPDLRAIRVVVSVVCCQSITTQRRQEIKSHFTNCPRVTHQSRSRPVVLFLLRFENPLVVSQLIGIISSAAHSQTYPYHNAISCSCAHKFGVFLRLHMRRLLEHRYLTRLRIEWLPTFSLIRLLVRDPCRVEIYYLFDMEVKRETSHKCARVVNRSLTLDSAEMQW
jgi:hypothetical protein